MKILLLHTNFPGWRENLKLLKQAAQRRKVQLALAHWSKIAMTNQGGKLKLRVAGRALENFDLIYFRAVGQYTEELNLVAQHALRARIPVIDRCYQHGETEKDRKSFECQAIVEAGLPYPETFFGSHQAIVDFASKNWQFPLVVKRTDSRKGRETYLIKSRSKLKEFFKDKPPSQRFLVQRFIENDGDIRLFLAGGEVLGAIKRGPKRLKFRLDKSTGKARIYKPSREMVRVAQKAAQVLGIDIAGVDLVIESSSGKPFILEVNRAPQYKVFMRVTRVNVPEKIIEFLKRV